MNEPKVVAEEIIDDIPYVQSDAVKALAQGYLILEQQLKESRVENERIKCGVKRMVDDLSDRLTYNPEMPRYKAELYLETKMMLKEFLVVQALTPKE